MSPRLAGLLVRVVVLAVLGGCASNALGVEPVRRGDELALADVQALLDALVEADNADDAARVAALYTDDAVWLPWAGPAVVGREAIAASYAQVFAAVDLQMSLIPTEIVTEGDHGHDLGRLGSIVRA